MEQGLPVQGKLSPMTFTTWKLIKHTWHTKWVRFHLKSDVMHASVQIGDWVLNADDKYTGWYPAKSVYRAYRPWYVPVHHYNLGLVKTNIQQPIPVSVWSMIRWWYFRGPTPRNCTAICAEALRQHGIDLPPDLVYLEDIEKAIHDCTGIQWESKEW